MTLEKELREETEKWLSRAKEKREEIVLVDKSKQDMMKNVDAYISDAKHFLEKNDFAPQSFDAVTLIHVFEHLPDPRQTLEIISEILKKDGILMMSFPNIDSFQSRIFKGKWLHIDPPRHLFFFSPKDFKI